MSNGKNVLLVFHLNFLKRNMGCNNYIYMIAKSLKNQGYNLDFFCTNMAENISEDFEKWNKQENNLIDNLYCIKLQSALFPRSFCSKEICNEFNKVINSKHYDFINIHYIQWADLIRYSHIPTGTELIYSLHDSTFIQQSYNYFEIEEIKEMFATELRNLSLFDKIACISYDEMLFWRHLLPRKIFYYIPYMQKSIKHEKIEKKYDLLFIGHANPYNVEGLIWFLENVYSKIKVNTKIIIAGKCLDIIKRDYSALYNMMQENNFQLIHFCENLSELYANTKIAIVPMLRGTGLKIKTIEALANNIPIVSTLLGVDGFCDKTLNGVLVSDDPTEFANNITKLLTNNKFYQDTLQIQKSYFSQNFDAENLNALIKNIFTSRAKISERLPLNKIQSINTFYRDKIITSISLKLFGFLPIFSAKTKGKYRIYKILGLPLFKVKQSSNNIATKYYFCGIPVLKVNKK